MGGRLSMPWGARPIGEPGRAMALLSLGSLLATLAIGLVLGLKAPFPTLGLTVLPIQIVQPLHVLLALFCVISGLTALTVMALDSISDRPWTRLGWTALWILLAFVSLGSLGIVAGFWSGVEYVPWPVVLTPLPLVLITALAIAFYQRLGRASALSPEASWLIGLGLILMALGLVERTGGLLAPLNFGRELSVEWHSLDIIFAGWNATLYGFGILILAKPGRGKPLRSRMLFALAAFTLISTFGHHHYMSPQPMLIKYIALTASMLAGLSFIRHCRAAVKARGATKAPETPAEPFLAAAETWSLVAIGTGITLAIPQINLILHGTWAVIGHSMCAVIGVNTMLLMAGFVHYLGPNDAALARRLAKMVRWTNIMLALVFLDFVAAGVVRGVLRLDHPFLEFQPVMLRFLWPLPVFGLGLAVSLTVLVVTVINSIRAGREEPPVVTVRPIEIPMIEPIEEAIEEPEQEPVEAGAI